MGTGATVGLVTLVTMGSVLPVFLLGANGPSIMGDLEFGSGGIGIAAGSYTAGLAVASLLLGRWLDPLTLRRAVLASLLLVALGGVTTASAPGLQVLGLGLFLSGVGSSAVQMASGRILSRVVTDARHGAAFGWFQSAKPIAVALAGMFGILAAIGLPWRSAFILVTGATTGLGAVLAFWCSTTPAVASVRRPAWHLEKPVLLLALLMAVGFALTNISTTFLPVTLQGVHGAQSGAGTLLLVGGMLAAVGRVLVGQLTDRTGWDEVRLVAPAYGLAGIGGLLISTQSVVGIVAGALLAFAFGWAFGGLLVAKGARLYPENSATVIGQLLLGGAVGGTLAPPLFGGAAALWGYGVAWAGFGALFLVLALLCLFPRRSEGVAVAT